MRSSHSKPRALPALLACGALLAGCNGAPPSRPKSQVDHPVQTKPDAGAQAVVTRDSFTPPEQFALMVDRAREESRHVGKPLKRMELPPSLQNLDYEKYITIRYRPEKSLWRNEPGHFEVQFFHVGLHYYEPLKMEVLEHDKLSLIPFNPELFSYDGVTPPPADAELGFAGFRIHANLNRADYRDEFIVFQGASYYRTVAKGQIYGLSGRGLAIDTGEPGPEEFPRFTEFVLVRPQANDTFMWVLAFLESPRVTGAYAFRIQPGDETQIEVTARVFPRSPIKVLGVAPLTSMFLYGEESPPNRFGGDHPNLKRPEAHDSDSLVSWSGQGEWLVRPLRNPPKTQVSTFRLDSPRGFGLIQRDRRPESYNDPEYAYERRPSAWIEPLDNWGPGSLRLLEIGTQLESDDNIGAMWVPDAIAPEADGLNLHYRVHIGMGLPTGLGPASQALDTRFKDLGGGRTRFEVEFAGAALTDANPQHPLEAIVSAHGGKITSQRVDQDASNGRAKLTFEVKRDGAGAVDLRAFLRSGPDASSETWVYLLSD
ncbi:MAG: glucan biosynthesis protein [Myxococcales bacterium]